MSRTAGYGTTRYHHLLDCGHTEVRRRPAPAPTLGCVECARAESRSAAFVEAMASLDAPVSLVSEEASLAIAVSTIRAELAGLLHVDLEDVSVRTSETRVLGAFVWVSADSLNILRSSA